MKILIFEGQFLTPGEKGWGGGGGGGTEGRGSGEGWKEGEWGGGA